jgi:hypothetical protein
MCLLSASILFRLDIFQSDEKGPNLFQLSADLGTPAVLTESIVPRFVYSSHPTSSLTFGNAPLLAGYRRYPLCRFYLLFFGPL